MTHRYRAFVAILYLCACLVWIAPAEAAFTEWTVIEVIDGNTVRCKNDTKGEVIYRLKGTQAPELDQPYGVAARDKLKELVLNKVVRTSGGTNDKDRNKLTRMRNNDGDVPEQMLKAGLTWHYTLDKGHVYADHPKGVDEAFAKAEREAREAERGLWEDKNPVPPWEWRDKKTAP